LIVFLTFCVILVTLVLQGLTLPSLIKILGLAGAAGPRNEEQEVRRLILQAALDRLEETRQGDSAGRAELYDDLSLHYHHRLASASPDHEERMSYAEGYIHYLDLSRTLLEVERQTALRLRDEGRITDELLREMENEMDLNETRLIASIDRRTTEASTI
jgi:CPA1 family monovalent cation:H+ antiporter